jgi:hypothetical protein
MAWQARSFTQIWKLARLHHQGRAVPAHHPTRRVGSSDTQVRAYSPTTQWPCPGTWSKPITSALSSGHWTQGTGAPATRSGRCDRFTTGREGRRPLDDRYESSLVPWSVTVGSGSSLARMR